MVYLVQSALLGLAVVVVHFGLGRRLSPGLGLVYLGATAGFLYLDAFRYYTNRLLSENLVLVLLPVALVLVLRAASGHPWAGRRSQASRSGRLLLTRPNLLLLGPAAVAFFIAYRGFGDRSLRVTTAMLGGVLVMIGFMAFRNYVVTGAPSAPVFTVTGHSVPSRILTGAGLVDRAGQWSPTSGAGCST